MIKRVTWFVGGVAAGAAGAGYAKKKVSQTVRRAADQVTEQLAPTKVVKTVVSATKQRVGDVVDAVREGRGAMRDKEDELKARRDRRVETLDAHLEPGDRLLVDGQPVESGRVIVLKRAPQEPKRRKRSRS